MRRLIVLVGLLACGRRPEGTYPVSSCLMLDWRDSSANSHLPRAVKLDPAKDTLSPMAFDYYHLLRPITPADSDLWFSITNAWWYKDDQDSLALMLVGRFVLVERAIISQGIIYSGPKAPMSRHDLW